MAARTVFVDTNILVYANWSGAERHAEARRRMAEIAGAGDEICISGQVLREFLTVVTRPQGLVTPMAVEEAAQSVEAFESLFRVLDDSSEIGQTLLEFVRRFDVKGRVIHDANIVATMSVHGVRRLLTANPADFRRFADIIDIEPL